MNDPSHQLTWGDLHDIQLKMYDKMRRDQGDRNEDGVDYDPDHPGISGDTAKNFIQGDELNDMFKNSNQQLDHVDNNGQRDQDGNLNRTTASCSRTIPMGRRRASTIPTCRRMETRSKRTPTMPKNYEAARVYSQKPAR